MTEKQKLVFQDKQGRVVRTFAWSGDRAHVILREDNRRVELHPDLESLHSRGIEFVELGEVASTSLAKAPFIIGELGQLNFVSDIESIQSDIPTVDESATPWRWSLFAFLMVGVAFSVSVVTWEPPPPKAEEPPPQHVVQIIKTAPKPKPANQPTAAVPNAKMAATPSTNRSASVRRFGALAAFGSLKGGNQRGGVNIGAINTTAGPGRGGTGGSGGVQTSLYGRGLVAAPVGPGGNIQGAGGYGTKGKGGGQAGYGELTLVGSTGSSLIPIGQEAIVEGGLDRDSIAAVIARNMGQVRFCYEQGLQTNPGLTGRVAVNFTISGSGIVKAAQVGSSTLNAEMVEQCIVMRLKSWKFPLPQGGVDVQVSYPFLLKRVGG